MRRALGLLLAGLALPAAADCDKIVLQPIEAVVLQGTFPVRVQALVDTGAELASLDSNLARQMGVDRPVVREILVRSANGVTRRKVVRLKFAIRGQMRLAEFSLIPRDGLPQPVLLGRRSLQGFLVDPGCADC